MTAGDAQAEAAALRAALEGTLEALVEVIEGHSVCCFVSNGVPGERPNLYDPANHKLDCPWVAAKAALATDAGVKLLEAVRMLARPYPDGRGMRAVAQWNQERLTARATLRELGVLKEQA